ncbi:LysR family transcriptional regulator [Pokkaliibacter plantistimulans]|uniref:LysR family transcriptional regulator n=2 Tax=Pseudomonadota TaxID=1224 RepID=A0ABX5LWG6_9GAMM|nr:LysR family transcriptional regulator [Pokkaliibacter plantistimulans]PPC79262.1 LysR family transcriptional regulator [Pokkaliibacter plantistimulans]PXF31001.1 LysR family transcriptional regulator [Pokkaliibacter plantistimulans]
MLDDAITLKKLEVFLTFMQTGTLAEAASALGMSTVSIHRAIHSLEEGLKCPLFRQEGRLLTPLPSARVLEEQGRQVLAALEEAVKATRETAGIHSNQFKLGALYSLTLATVPKLIAGLKLRKGDLNIELTLDSNQVLFRKLRSLELDAILVSLDRDFSEPDCLALPLFSDDIFLAAPLGSPYADSQEVGLPELKDATFVTLTQGFATYTDSFRAFERAGFTPNVVMQVSDIFSLISMVSAGMGYALLPGRVEAVFENKIQLIPLKDPCRMQQHIAMVCLASRERDPRILHCIAECRAYARQYLQEKQGV